ncbi:PQQ-dependent sugar dehydrogenase [Elstera litoralis]|uniref:PQQ-dependent sugar dehydrogenase n=1 Tax=Elstera litoralis TaxID=552518 RepID=UPI000B138C61|nr:PQQ-dependent sugar dehydrogenase [Elstera litoralis]
MRFALMIGGWVLGALIGVPAQGQTPSEPSARIPNIAEVVTVAKGLENPWGMAFLPDGRLLVTERPGRLRLVARDGRLSEPLTGVPQVVARGQGGLLDVALDPQFADNKLVYLSFSEGGPGGAGTAVARGTLTASGLDDVRVIFRQSPKVNGTAHFGSRLAFAPDASLFITLGDRFSYRDSAQDLTSTLGKIVRVRRDGSPPSDNPFLTRSDAKPEIWSYGHRNVQGAAINPATGQLWTIEHGAQGGDELNRPQAGKNYGWPVITFGKDYNGSKIGIGSKAPGMEQPVQYWDPSIAPSGLLFYTGKAYPGWTGSLFTGSLKFGALVRMTLQGETVVSEERLLDAMGERIRDVRQGPDGLIYLLTDSAEGRVLRLNPLTKKP